MGAFFLGGAGVDANAMFDADIALALTAGVLLNLTPDHLDRHGTMQHYAAIKESQGGAGKGGKRVI